MGGVGNMDREVLLKTQRFSEVQVRLLRKELSINLSSRG